MANHLILALDEETKKWCEEHGINAYLLALQVHKSQEGTGGWGCGMGTAPSRFFLREAITLSSPLLCLCLLR